MTPFTLLHATGFQLHLPVEGVDHLAPGLVDRLGNAAARSLLRLAEVARRESAHAVFLAGDILSPEACSPADVAALLDLCEQLEAAGIPLLWLWGEAEHRGEWWEELPFEGVHIFSGRQLEVRTVATAGGPLQIIALPYREQAAGPMTLIPVGASGSQAEPLTVGLAYGYTPGELPQLGGISYWALGGNGARLEAHVGGIKAHDPGPALYRTPSRWDPPAASIVEMHGAHRVFVRPVSVAAVRWETITLYLSADSTPTTLASQLVQEVEARRAAGDGDWLFRLRLEGPPEALLLARAQKLDLELIELLRVRYGQHAPFVWPGEVLWEATEPWPQSWLNEDSFRGELLRQGGEFLRSASVDRSDATRGSCEGAEETTEEWEALVKQALMVGLEALEGGLSPSSGRGAT